jgi:[ribosomal protein S5]-alanine N-acetyltransferase
MPVHLTGEVGAGRVRADMMRGVAVTRLITAEDAPVLSELMEANAAFLAPWSPRRPPAYATVAGQRRAITGLLAAYVKGTVLPHVIVCDGDVVGRVTLSDISHGTFASCHLGYWLSESHNGRGLATAAVAEIVAIGFRTLGLHRIEAGTIPRNVRSRGVLERNGFVAFGLAPSYLEIAGEWEDHILYQVLNETEHGSAPRSAAQVVDAFYVIQRRFYAGEPVDEQLAGCLDADVAWHVPGRNLIAGDYRGRDEVMAYLRRRRDLADRSLVVTPRGTLADATRVVHFADGEATRGGETRRWRTVGIFEVAEQRIRECWLVPFDQHAFDQVWA